MNRCAFVTLPLFLLASSDLAAADYPDMVGVWSGHIRSVSSGTGEVAKGGAVISESDLHFTVEHQDGETFMGKTRSTSTPAGTPSTRVWGTIRSTGDEAMFITSTGGRGQLWFHDDTTFEYCLTNLQAEVMTAYCAKLTKQR